MEFIRSDLACDFTQEIQKHCHGDGYTVLELSKKGLPIIEVEIKNEHTERFLGKKIGKYSTVCIGTEWIYNKEKSENIKHVVADIFENMLLSDSKKFSKFLIVGLGNRALTSDALGPFTIENIDISEHKSAKYSIYLSVPGIEAITGIKTVDQIKIICDKIKADCVILIDALVARSVDRMCSTIQISNTGIAPGSGIAGFKDEISKTSLGVSVFSIGMPTVVSSSTMISDILRNKKSSDDIIKHHLKDEKSYFVTLSEADIIVSKAASFIAEAINYVLKEYTV
ncbi:MAG: GPR endopeptidase [Clostridia bacterium]|nr:GPR endopeptidase [Clostridia bacterium]